jgi:hypothetical protein
VQAGECPAIAQRKILVIEQHRGGDERAGKRSAAGLIAPGD